MGSSRDYDNISTSDNRLPFQVVTITSPDQRSAEVAPLEELEQLFSDQYSPATINELPLLISTSDPYGMRLGSGGGTIAAIDLSDRRYNTYFEENESHSLLIVHAGGDSSRCPTQMIVGKAWTSLPVKSPGIDHGIVTNPTFLLVEALCRFLRNIPLGSIVIAASDVIISLNESDNEVKPYDFDGVEMNSVIGVAVPVAHEVASNHGVFIVNNMDCATNKIFSVKKYLQKPSIETLKEVNGAQALVDTGVVIFLPKAACTLRELISNELELWTEAGVKRFGEKGEDLSKIDLYSHIMLALTTEDTAQYSRDEMQKLYLSNFQSSTSELKFTLISIFENFQSLTFKVCIVPKGYFVHLGTTRELLEFITHGSDYVDDFDSSIVRKQYSSFGRAYHLTKRESCLVVKNAEKIDQTSVIVNSLIIGIDMIGAYTLIEHSCLDHLGISIGSNCLLSGLRCNISFPNYLSSIPSQCCFQQIKIRNNDEYAFIILHVSENIKDLCTSFCGHELDYLLSQLNLCRSDFWPNSNIIENIWNARIFPILTIDSSKKIDVECLNWFFFVMENHPLGSVDKVKESITMWRHRKRVSLSELSSISDAKAEFLFRQCIKDEIIKKKNLELEHIRHVFLRRVNKGIDFRSVIASYLSGDLIDLLSVFKVFDDILLYSFDQSQFDIASRVSMSMSLLLRQILLLQSGSMDCDNTFLIDKTSPDITNQTQRMFKEIYTGCCQRRDECLRRFNRANCDELRMHISTLETMSSSFTALCIASGFQSHCLHNRHFSMNNEFQFKNWVFVSAPARVDIAGGWSDTPPISYEHGGAVTCLAVQIQGLRPLSARCRYINHADCILTTEERCITNGNIVSSSSIEIQTIKDLMNFCDPYASAALLKASIVCVAKMFNNEVFENIPDTLRIKTLFTMCFGCAYGIELISTSLLPRGSGLGVSSILGGCVIKALIHTFCGSQENFDEQQLIQAVLTLEQLMTTGGGWQDQVGGLIAGAKIGRSRLHIFTPTINIENIAIPDNVLKQLEKRLILGFTGKPRLAKDILIKVLRRWNRRCPKICQNVDDLVRGAESAALVLRHGDLYHLGEILSSYWSQKKVMAGNDVEPPEVSRVIELLTTESLITGASLCGAGGGGFLAMITSEGIDRDHIESFFDNLKNSSTPFDCGIQWYNCSVATVGVANAYIPFDEEFCLDWLQIESYTT